jgi:hypothetical protein
VDDRASRPRSGCYGYVGTQRAPSASHPQAMAGGCPAPVGAAPSHSSSGISSGVQCSPPIRPSAVSSVDRGSTSASIQGKRRRTIGAHTSAGGSNAMPSPFATSHPWTSTSLAPRAPVATGHRAQSTQGELCSGEQVSRAHRFPLPHRPGRLRRAFPGAGPRAETVRPRPRTDRRILVPCSCASATPTMRPKRAAAPPPRSVLKRRLQDARSVPPW